MKTALTIAGSDSSGGAGIQADLKTFQAHGVFGMSAVTAVTVQNTQEVIDVQEVRPDIVHRQITCLFEDIEIHAVKIGMVASVELIQAISNALRSVRRPPVVLDPVMISKSGYKLLDDNARQALREHLFPLADVVTPNIHEAESLTGENIRDIEAMKSAARAISKMGAKQVIVKGGHLGEADATDIVFDGDDFEMVEGTRVATCNTHGTGCTFSSAVAANLALGQDFRQAVRNAKLYITGAIENALDIGKGFGPTNHFYDLYRRAGLTA